MVRMYAGILSMLVVLVSGVWSQPSGDRVCLAFQSGQADFTVEGKINSLEQNKFTLNSEENMIFHVRYDEKTEIKSEDGSPAASKDLRVGLAVRVAGNFTESGEIAAARIELLKSSAKK